MCEGFGQESPEQIVAQQSSSPTTVVDEQVLDGLEQPVSLSLQAAKEALKTYSTNRSKEFNTTFEWVRAFFTWITCKWNQTPYEPLDADNKIDAADNLVAVMGGDLELEEPVMHERPLNQAVTRADYDKFKERSKYVWKQGEENESGKLFHTQGEGTFRKTVKEKEVSLPDFPAFKFEKVTGSLPQDLSDKKNTYILTQQGQEQALYYIRPNGQPKALVMQGEISMTDLLNVLAGTSKTQTEKEVMLASKVQGMLPTRAQREAVKAGRLGAIVDRVGGVNAHLMARLHVSVEQAEAKAEQQRTNRPGPR